MLGFLSVGALSIGLCIGIAELTKNSVEHKTFNIGQVPPTIAQSFSDVSSLQILLQTIVKVQSPTQRFIELHELLTSLNANQLLQLLSASQDMQGTSRLQAVQVKIVEQLASVDPKKALRQVWDFPNHLQRKLLTVIFGNWSHINMREALNRAEKLEVSYRNIAIEAVLLEFINIADPNSINNSRSLDVKKIASQVDVESKVTQSVEHPTRALNLIVNSNLDENQQLDLLQRLFRTWIRQDGIDGTLPLLSEVCDLFPDNTTLIDALVVDIASFDAKDTWEYLLSNPFEMQQQAMEVTLAAWAEKEPESVLTALGGLEQVHLRFRSYYTLIEVWARINPNSLFENIQHFPQEFRDSAGSSAISRLARTGSLNEVKENLQEMKLQQAPVDNASREFVSAWARIDPAEATKWIIEFANDNLVLQGSLLSLALPKLALVDAEEAMEVAHGYPYDESISFMTPDTYVVQGLASSGRLESARAMLAKVREPMRLGSFAALGRSFIEFGHHDKAIELAEELSETAQEDYFAAIADVWLSLSPNHLIDSLEYLPNEGVRSAVAQKTLELQKYGSYLSLEQTEYVRTFLPETDYP